MSYSAIILSIVFLFCSLPLCAQVKTPANPQSGAVKQIDPFRKEEKPKSVEKKPNLFQDLLDQKIELPKKKRPAAPPKKKSTENADNPFEDLEADNPFDSGGSGNPFLTDDSDDFGGSFEEPKSVNPANPFAAGDPFADEDPRNKGGQPTKAVKPKGPTNQAKPKAKQTASDEPLMNPFLD